MATTTTKLALTKPDGTDLVDIAVLNANADKIDAASGATICTSSTRPASPFNGQVIFETDTLNALVYRLSTTSWNILGGSTVASEPPAGAGNGNFWWDSDNGKLYIYYSDGNSSQWVSVMPSQTVVDVTQNYIINGAFDIWQRGTGLLTATGTTNGFVSDRWQMFRAGFASGASCYKPSGPLGFQSAARVQRDASNTSTAVLFLAQTLESINSIPLAGKTVTLSFYAKAGANYSSASSALTANIAQGTGTDQNVASGFSGSLGAAASSTVTLTTSWQRFSVTGTVNVASTQLGVYFSYTPVGTAGASDYYEITGVQLEAGPIATAFRRNAPSIEAELAACRRYYYRITAESTFGILTSGAASGPSGGYFIVKYPVKLRTAVTAYEYANVAVCRFGDPHTAVTSFSMDANVNNTEFSGAGWTVSGTPFTKGDVVAALGNSNGAAYLGFSAEL